MIDTHTHLYLPEFEEDGCASAVERALAAGVGHLVLPNVDESSVEPMLRLHSQFPESTSVAMGLHPTEVGDDWREIVSLVEERLAGGGYVAVGEVGIDLYWDASRREQQMEAFRAQLALAKKYSLPVIIHCREGLPEVLECIAAEDAADAGLLFHSFTGTADDARRILEAAPSAMFGINGVVTFKSAKALREALPTIGVERMVFETDSPYLAPVPYRGRRNESAYIGNVCRCVAAELGLDDDALEAATDDNARNFFRLGG